MIECPSCGGGLRFDIKSKRMICDLCDSHFDPHSIDTKRGESAETGVNEYQTAVFLCPSCGAELMTNDENDAVGFCPFCGGASMIFSQIRQQWKPDYVVPFSITKDNAKLIYRMAGAKSPFVSRKYSNSKAVDSLRGIYMPYWVDEAEYDDDYSVDVVFREVSPSKSIAITDNRFAGHAKGTISYVHDASLRFSDDISEALAPYSLSEAEDFSEAYLAGFYTEISDASIEDYDERFEEALANMQGEVIGRDKRMLDCIEQWGTQYAVLETKPYKPMKQKSRNIKRLLFPIWFMGKKRKNGITYAVINGATGKISADFPLSPLRILLTALGMGGLLFGISFFLPAVTAEVCLSICAVFTLIGHLIMERAYQKMMETKLNIIVKTADRYALSGFVLMLISGAVRLLKYNMLKPILIVIGTALFLYTVLFLGFLVKSSARIRRELKKNRSVKYRPELLKEAKRFRTAKWIIFTLEFLLIIVSVVLLVLRVSDPIYLFGLCLLMLVDLFAAAMAVIRFQRAMAVRRPPQMNKKGAQYDEN